MNYIILCGGRKFIIALLSLLGTFIGLYSGAVADIQAGVIIVAVLGLYNYGNNESKKIVKEKENAE